MAQSIRVSDRLYQEASTACAVSSRSLAQQVEHWAKLGQMVDSEACQNSVLLEGAIKRQHQRDATQVERGELDPRSLFLFSRELAQKTIVTHKSIDFEGLAEDYA